MSDKKEDFKLFRFIDPHDPERDKKTKEAILKGEIPTTVVYEKKEEKEQGEMSLIEYILGRGDND